MRISEMPLQDRRDYNEYLAFCEAQGIAPTPLHIYTGQIGVIEVAVKMFPDLSPVEAADKIIPLLDKSRMEPLIQNQATPCGSCGGGKVR